MHVGWTLVALLAGAASCTSVLGVDGEYDAGTGTGTTTPSTTTSSAGAGGATSTTSSSSSGSSQSGTTTTTQGSGSGGGDGGGGQGGSSLCGDGDACLLGDRIGLGDAEDVRLATSPWAGAPRGAVLVRDGDTSSLYDLDDTSMARIVFDQQADLTDWLAAPFANADTVGIARLDAATASVTLQHGRTTFGDLITGKLPPLAAAGSAEGAFFLSGGFSVAPHVHHVSMDGAEDSGPSFCDPPGDGPVLGLAAFGSEWLAASGCARGVEVQHGRLSGALEAGFQLGDAVEFEAVAVAASEVGGAVVLRGADGIAVWWVQPGAGNDGGWGVHGVPHPRGGRSPSVAVDGNRVLVAYERGSGKIGVTRCEGGGLNLGCDDLTMQPSEFDGTRPSIAFDGEVYWLAWVDEAQAWLAPIEIGAFD